MGSWLKVNGEAIYGIRKWEKAPTVKPETTVYYSKKGSDLYVITKWQDKAIVVESTGKAESVSMLSYKDKVKYSVSAGKLTITPPSVSPSTNPCQYAWVYKVTNAMHK